MYCPECGEIIEVGSLSCKYCGTVFDKTGESVRGSNGGYFGENSSTMDNEEMELNKSDDSRQQRPRISTKKRQGLGKNKHDNMHYKRRRSTLPIVIIAFLLGGVVASCALFFFGKMGGTRNGGVLSTATKTESNSGEKKEQNSSDNKQNTSVSSSKTEERKTTSKTTDDDSVKKISLTIWTPQEDQSGDNWLKKICDRFDALHPEWDISYKYEVCAEWEVKIKMADQESGADVFMYANDLIPDLVEMGAIAEIGGKTLEEIKANSSEMTMATVTHNDAVYGIPYTGNTWFMYYNKEIFEKKDLKNLDSMLARGKVAFPLNNSWYFASFYAANGCTLFGKNGDDESAGIQFDGKAGTEVTEYLVRLVKNKNFVNDSNARGLDGFGKGEIGAFFSGVWDYNIAVEVLGGDASKIGICVAPPIIVNGKEKQLKAFAGSKAIGVNPHTKYPQAAIALAAFMGSTEAQQLHYELRGIIPTDKYVDVGDDALAKVQMDAMEFGSIKQPIFAGMSRYWDPATQMANDILDGKVTKSNAATRTEEMNTAMNTAVFW